MTKTTRDAILQKIVLRAQRRILRDIRAGVVPKSASSVSELHDYVDGNMYFLTRAGHFDRALNPLVVSLGGGRYDSDAMWDLLNEAQTEVSDWLRAGGAKSAG